jgi:hypothetical protein
VRIICEPKIGCSSNAEKSDHIAAGLVQAEGGELIDGDDVAEILSRRHSRRLSTTMKRFTPIARSMISRT